MTSTELQIVISSSHFH